MDPIYLDTEPKRSTLTLIIALVCALAITAGLFGGYLLLRRRHAQNEKAQQDAAASPQTKATGPPLLQVYEDDAMLKAGQATISGTVVNISPENT
jgi:flagellar basal body-associated protein FliL